MGDEARTDLYPLKDVATIRWLEDMPADLVSVIEQLSPDHKAAVRDLGYTDIKASQYFMDVLNQVLFHRDPMSLRVALSHEKDRLESQLRQGQARIQNIVDYLRPRSRRHLDNFVAEHRLHNLDRALRFIEDALFILQANSLKQGRDRIREVFAKWYQHTGNLLFVSIEIT